MSLRSRQLLAAKALFALLVMTAQPMRTQGNMTQGDILSETLNGVPKGSLGVAMVCRNQKPCCLAFAFGQGQLFGHFFVVSHDGKR
jgi:hypothetical protein